MVGERVIEEYCLTRPSSVRCSDEQRQTKGLATMMELKAMPAIAKGASDSQSAVAEEDASSFETKEGEVIKLKPSHLPLMNQVLAHLQDFEGTLHCF